MCVGKRVQQPLLELDSSVVDNAKQQRKFNKDFDSDLLYKEDILAVSTYYIKAVLFGVSGYIEGYISQFRNSLHYK